MYLMSLLSLYTIYFRLESMSVLLNLLLATTTVVGVQCAPRYYRYEDGKADTAPRSYKDAPFYYGGDAPISSKDEKSAPAIKPFYYGGDAPKPFYYGGDYGDYYYGHDAPISSKDEKSAPAIKPFYYGGDAPKPFYYGGDYGDYYYEKQDSQF